MNRDDLLCHLIAALVLSPFWVVLLLRLAGVDATITMGRP